uniref:Uncharacterized protein n=1 Tax=Plectus sambesii TaxID=2011161 RepID=A0A914WGS5_9BILA
MRCTCNSDQLPPPTPRAFKEEICNVKSVDDPLNELATSPRTLAACAAEQDPATNAHLLNQESGSVKFVEDLLNEPAIDALMFACDASL